MNTTFLALQVRIGRMVRLALAAVLLTGVLFDGGSIPSALAGTQTDIPGPAGSGEFGTVTVLPNGNFVVVDPYYDAPGPNADVGAVYLYNGASGALISILTGSLANDRVGSSGVKVLSNGNYVVVSREWHYEVGAVTWGNGTTGVSGAVSAGNSLVGSTMGDLVGYDGITALSNGNYVVVSPNWHNGEAPAAGAVTWGNGSTGTRGAVSAANSLVGSTDGDQVGYCDIYYFNCVTALSNGNYVVASPNWDNGAAADAGAVTWGNGSIGTRGVVSAANSLVGSTTDDWVASVSELSNGNYVVASPNWDNGAAANAGAVTWGDGSTGTSGAVSAANSLVGSSDGDNIGFCEYSNCVTALSNGNYVVASPAWDNGAAANGGAVTWGDGSTGTSGVVSEANSLAGSTDGDQVGYCIFSHCVTALSNGNYVVASPHWDNGAAADAGAVTWGNGATGVSGAVSAANSLVGSTMDDKIGFYRVTALSNGNYVSASPYWDNGVAADTGAVTWGNGSTGVNGAVSAANSLVGSSDGDHVGCYGDSTDFYSPCYYGGVTVLSNGNYVVASPWWHDGGAVTWGNGTTGVSGAVSAANSLVSSGSVTALSNGNYLVASPGWDNGAAANAGAVTWGNGSTGTSGAVSEANSLVGSTAGDLIGSGGITELSNGNYVVASPNWDNWVAADAGAVTWGNGATGVSGAVSAANSLVGSTTDDNIGFYSVTALSNGNYVSASPYWDNRVAANAGAVTWGNGSTGTRGVVSAANSLVGSSDGDHVGCYGDSTDSYSPCYYGGVTALSNGNYVVVSREWRHDVGAVTWGNGMTGVSRPVSAANSLVGSTDGDQVGYCIFSNCMTALSNGNYVVASPNWDNGAAVDAGAVTWGNGSTGTSGVVSAANSLVGSTKGDQVGYCLFSNCVTALSNSNYVVESWSWDNGAAVDAGALTLGHGMACGAGPTAGPISAANSVLGGSSGAIHTMNFSYDAVNHQLVVGRPEDNMVSLVAASECTFHFFPRIVK